MNRPEVINLCTTNPHTPGFMRVTSVGYGDLSKIQMGRDPQDENSFGCSAGPLASHHEAMTGLIEFLEQNSITPVVTIAKTLSPDSFEYIAAVEVKGKDNVDKLISLSERTAAAENLISKKRQAVG
jgi:hypothetical protein